MLLIFCGISSREIKSPPFPPYWGLAQSQRLRIPWAHQATENPHPKDPRGCQEEGLGWLENFRLSPNWEVPGMDSWGQAQLLSLLSLVPGSFSNFDGPENFKLITHSECCHQPKNNHLLKHSWLQHSKDTRICTNAAAEVRHPAELPQWEAGMYYGVEMG